MEFPEIRQLTETVLIDGRESPLTLTGDGQFLWPDGGRRWLSVDKEVPWFSVAAEGRGRVIKVRALIEKGGDGRRATSLRGRGVRSWRVASSLWVDRRGCVFSSIHLVVKKIAPRIFANEVRPLFEDSGIRLDIKETQYQLHAKEIANSLDLSIYDGIVCISGDGILTEVMNGLLGREDWDAHRGAGTGNETAQSILNDVGQPCSPSYATLAIILGHKQSLDVATIFQKDKKFFIVLMPAWDLVADIDIESEKYRWMGSARIDFYVRSIFRISFVPAPGYESYGEPLSSGKTMLEDFSEAKGTGYWGPDVRLDESSWRTIEGPFVSIWPHNVPWGGKNTMAALEAQLSNEQHLKLPYVTYLKVKAFVLEPGSQTEDPTKGGIIDIDGEVLARGTGTYKCE